MPDSTSKNAAIGSANRVAKSPTTSVALSAVAASAITPASAHLTARARASSRREGTRHGVAGCHIFYRRPPLHRGNARRGADHAPPPSFDPLSGYTIPSEIARCYLPEQWPRFLEKNAEALL